MSGAICSACGLVLPPDSAESEANGTPSCQQHASRPTRLPFLLGVYLATNAIPDAATVVDGPDCLFFKSEFIHGRHDLRSTLLDVGGQHRILPSHVNTDDVAQSRGERAATLIAHAADLPWTDLVMITSLPMVTIIGTQYSPLLRSMAEQAQADLVEVRGRSLEGDWLDGYEDTLVALAERLLATAGQGPHEAAHDQESISVIGYLMDRNEEDHLGNLRELERLISGMGLKLETVWLSGRPWAELRRATRSTTLVALPTGRRAAQIIAKRSGARVLELDTPFGLQSTMRWLRALGDATGRQQRAEALIDEELSKLVPLLEWAVPHLFLGKRVVFVAAPDLLGGFVELADELGLVIALAGSPSLRPRWLEGVAALEHTPLFFDAEVTAASSHFRDDHGRPDMVIGNSELLRQWHSQCARLELGFPSYHDHAFFDRPYLGFRGYLCFVQRMATALGTAL